VQAALHQKLAAALTDQLDALGRRRIAMRRIDNLIAADVEIIFMRDRGDLVLWPDEDRDDHARLCRFGRTAQRGFIARVDNDCYRRLHLLGSFDQTFVLGMSCMA